MVDVTVTTVLTGALLALLAVVPMTEVAVLLVGPEEEAAPLMAPLTALTTVEVMEATVEETILDVVPLEAGTGMAVGMASWSGTLHIRVNSL